LKTVAHSLSASAGLRATNIPEIEQYVSTFTRQFDGVCNTFAMEATKPYSATLPPGFTSETALQHILSVMKVHFNKIIKYLQSKDDISAKIQLFLSMLLKDRINFGKLAVQPIFSMHREQSGFGLSPKQRRDGTPKSISRESSVHFTEDEVSEGDDFEPFEENIKL